MQASAGAARACVRGRESEWAREHAVRLCDLFFNLVGDVVRMVVVTEKRLKGWEQTWGVGNVMGPTTPPMCRLASTKTMETEENKDGEKNIELKKEETKENSSKVTCARLKTVSRKRNKDIKERWEG